MFNMLCFNQFYLDKNRKSAQRSMNARLLLPRILKTAKKIKISYTGSYVPVLAA